MVVKGDIRKHLILFTCFLLVMPLHSIVFPSVAKGILLEQNEVEAINNIKKEEESITVQKSDQSQLSISILKPHDESSFNVTEVVLSIKANSESVQPTSVVVLKEGEELDSIKLDEGINEVPVKLTKYDEGNYEIQALGKTDDMDLSSNIIEFEIDRTAPEIELKSDEKNFINDAIIVGNTEEEIPVTLTIEDHTLETTSDEEGDFSFDLNGIVKTDQFSVLLSAEDVAGNVGTLSATFALDQTRPFVSTELFPRANMTQVPIDTKVQAKIIDNNPILKGNIPPDALEVYEAGKSTPVGGVIDFNEQTGVITFTPAVHLKSSTKYFVFVNNLITDQAGNLIHSRNWSFSTKSNSAYMNPHGNYELNTNTCNTCHGVHVAMDSGLMEPSDEIKEKLTDKSDSVNSYCMACHDGTVASSMPEMNGHSNHITKTMGDNGTIASSSCGSCHDVHLGWHETNPSLIKDHFVFDHGQRRTENGELVGVIDSNNKLCESCHENDALEKRLDIRVTYDQYRNSSWNTGKDQLREGQTSFGKQEDYSLCLSCHNSEVKENNPRIEDIKQHYSNQNTGRMAHFINSNRVNDGSLLNGYMPCADCHETHGSNNIGLIKENLGHNNTQTYEKTEIGWGPSEVRRFCLSCHNNSTEMYGNVLTFSVGEGGEEHPHNGSESCFACHGSGTNTPFFEEVHSVRK